MSKLLMNCSKKMQFHCISKGDTLFRICKLFFNLDDKADNFYVILKGEVDIKRPIIFREDKITADQYFNQLLEMVSKGDEELVRITIKENFYLYPIHMKDIHNLKNILFNIRLRKTIFSKEKFEANEVQDLFKNINRDPLIDLDLNLTTQIISDYIRRNS